MGLWGIGVLSRLGPADTCLRLGVGAGRGGQLRRRPGTLIELADSRAGARTRGTPDRGWQWEVWGRGGVCVCVGGGGGRGLADVFLDVLVEEHRGGDGPSGVEAWICARIAAEVGLAAMGHRSCGWEG